MTSKFYGPAKKADMITENKKENDTTHNRKIRERTLEASEARIEEDDDSVFARITPEDCAGGVYRNVR
jgi:hypothetical protein